MSSINPVIGPDPYLFDVRVQTDNISHVWYWGWDENHKETGCTQNPLDLNIYSDVHYEVPANWVHKDMWVSLLFCAGGKHPEWGKFHLGPDLSLAPRKNGKYRYKVDFYPHFNDCVEMYVKQFNIQGQAVVLEVLR